MTVSTDFPVHPERRDHLATQESLDQPEPLDLRVSKETAARLVITEFLEKLEEQENPESVDQKEVPVALDPKVSKVFLENLDDLDLPDPKVQLDLLESPDLRVDLETKVFKDFPVRWVDQE